MTGRIVIMAVVGACALTACSSSIPDVPMSEKVACKNVAGVHAVERTAAATAAIGKSSVAQATRVERELVVRMAGIEQSLAAGGLRRAVGEWRAAMVAELQNPNDEVRAVATQDARDRVDDICAIPRLPRS
ncbi:MAG TPA: hypothetical protein VMY88_10765 [Acidimicrobiales bacterium]|nr:hypothetical protein [Acidimicrobiales bacterium]